MLLKLQVRLIRALSLLFPRIVFTRLVSQVCLSRTHLMHRSAVPASVVSLLTSGCLLCLLSIFVHSTSSFGKPILLSSRPSLVLSAAKLNASAPVRCTSKTAWIGGGYVEQDCYTALDRFYDREALRFKGERFEWLARGQKPVGRDVVWTPRAYVVGMWNHAFTLFRRIWRTKFGLLKTPARLLSS